MADLMTDKEIAAAAKIDEDRAIELWKMKKLIRRLTEARGNGTSMISLVIPPKDQYVLCCHILIVVASSVDRRRPQRNHQTTD